MRNSIFTITALVVIILVVTPSPGQVRLFTTYPDSVSLSGDAQQMISDFVSRAKGVNPRLDLEINLVVHTTQNLLYYGDYQKIIVVPLWSDVPGRQKDFFTSVAGSYNEGIRLFGLFYNGFLLAHEMAHALQFAKGKLDWENMYQVEYVANEIAMAYWRSSGWEDELRECYEFARFYLSLLPEPVPVNEDPKEYFSLNYAMIELDPFKSSYFQFMQFVEIYENPDLPSFEEYLARFFKK